MPSTYSPLKIQLMATGENNTTWGDITNLNLGTALEEAIVGSADVTFASADVTLTLTDTNASQTARNMRLRCTGTTGGSTRNLIVPSIEKPYIVKNDCADSVVVKTAAGTGITVPAGKTTWVYSDATNVVDATTHLSSLTLGTDLAVSDGGTGASTFTANGVIYGNTTSALLATAAGTTGQVLVGNTGGAPSWATLTGIGVTSFSAGTTGLTPSTATTGAITLAGTLGVANGGTGTTTAFTTGSVVFAGASGVYSQDNANLFWDDTNNRLGIGTATPTATLTANGTAKIGEGAASNTSKLMVNTLSGTSAGIQLIQDANESWIIQNPASTNVLTFGNSGTERMRITSGGDVGVGTSSPGAKLHVVGGNIAVDADSRKIGYITDGTAANTGYMVPYDGSGFLSLHSNFATAGIKFHTGTSNTERMRIDASGNVGIGTSAPSYVLNTNYNANATFTNTGSDFTQMWQNSGVNALGVALADDLTARFVANNGYAIAFNSASSEFMRITSGGNVGIGTSSPNAKLHVSGNMQVVGTSGVASTTLIGAIAGVSNGHEIIQSAADAISYQWRLGSNNIAMTLDSAGSLGIGTSSASYKLDVYGGASGTDTRLRIANAASNIFAGIFSDNTTFIGGTFAQPLLFLTNAVERMRIDSSGNLLVGTTTANGILSVVGNQLSVTSGAGSATLGLQIKGSPLTAIPAGQTQGYIATGDSGIGTAGDLLLAPRTDVACNIRFITGTTPAERMRIDSTGNVGIGIATPSNKLQVAGITRINDATNSTAVTIDASTTGGLTSIITQFGGSQLALGSAGSERMRLDASGNLGVGTTSPGARLETSVTSTGATVEVLRLSNPGSGANTQAQINFSTTSTSYATITGGYGATAPQMTFNLPSATAGNYIWQVSSVEQMRLDSAGNVGIGTPTPRGNLSVGTNSSANGTVRSIHLGYTAGDFYGYRLTNTNSPGSFAAGLFNIQRGTTSAWVNDFTINNDGNVGIGGDPTGYGKLAVIGGNIGVSQDGSTVTTIRGNAGISNIGAFNSTGASLSFSTAPSGSGEVERMRIDSTGNVIIGTTATNNKFFVTYSNPVSVPAAGAGGHCTAFGAAGYGLATGAITNGNAYLQATRWDGTAANYDLLLQPNGGYLLVGRTSRATGISTILVETEGRYGSHVTGLSSYSFGVNGANFTICDYSNGSTEIERLRIDSSGNLLVGTTATGGSGTTIYSSANNGNVGRIDIGKSASGTATAMTFRYGASAVGSITYDDTATAYNTSSDYRLKDIDGPVANSGAYIDALKPVQGSWKADGSRFIGLLAHEVQEVSETPIATGEKDGEEMQAMDYSAPELIANLIAEIQSLRARVAQLEGN